MPRTTITPENRTTADTERWPPFKFVNKDERARVSCLEVQWSPDGARQVPAPWYEWVHRLERPKEKDGQPLQKKVTRRDRDGNETTEMVWDIDWVSSPICLGDKAILADKHIDPVNCPACRAADEHPSFPGLTPPVIRYAMNIVRFSTRPGGWILAEPFSAQILVWAFTEKRFGRLDDLNRKVAARGNVAAQCPNGATERPMDLSDVDLLLGPCEDINWQRYDIDLDEGWALWKQSQPAVNFISALWFGEGNRASDEQLQAACGKPVTNRAYLDSDIAKTIAGWNKALNGPGAAPTVDALGMNFGGQPAQAAMANGMTAMAAELGQPMPAAPSMAVPAVPQPTVQPQPSGPQSPPPAILPQGVPAVTQPTVQPTPPGPAPVAQQVIPAPATPEQMLAAAGAPGLGQFAPQPVQPAAPQPAAPQPPSAFMQAAAPELAALQAAQMQHLQARGVPVPPTPSPAPATALVPAVPAAPVTAAPAPPTAPAGFAAAPAAPVSTAAPQMPTSMTPPTPQPGQAGTPDAASLFAAPAPAAPAPGESVEFDQLAKF